MPNPDDLPIFRPQLGGGRGPTSRSGARSFRSAVLAGARRGAGGQQKAFRSRIAVHAPTASSRRVVVKAHLVKMTASGAKACALHIRYIERDGVEKDGTKGRLYGPDGPVPASAFEEPRLGEKHQFRLIVSPEDAKDLDLTDYMRRYVARIEKDLGRKLEWAAVNHYDTDHPHAHLVIRGVDREGRELRIDRGYISNGLRFRAQELATEDLGPRHDLDIRRAYSREVSQERFTSLDRAIAGRARGNVIHLSDLQTHRPPETSHLVARLEHLEALRLATRTSRSSWALADGWQDQLRELGNRGDILKQIHLAIGGDPSRYRALRDGQALEPDPGSARNVVTGRVASKGLSDELRGAYYAVVEAPDGRAYHLKLDPRAAETVRTGDIVSFTTRPEPAVTPADGAIQDVARAHGNVVVASPELPPAHARRLRELEKLGLAKPDGPGRWSVASDLMEQLEARHRQVPQHRHRILVHAEPLSLSAQVHHRGPAWLDRVNAESLAPYGFGADVRRALVQREDALRRLGIDPRDPKRQPKLRELERRHVGEQLAQHRRETFVPAPSAFRGRVSLPERGEAAGYAIISDGDRFAVLRSTPALRAAAGKQVVLKRDAKGRVVAEASPERDVER